MNRHTQPAGRWKGGAAGAALAVLLGLLFLPHPLGHGLANLSFDLPFRWRANQPAQGVIIIYMDDYSAKALAQKWGEAIWDRTLHARLLNHLKDCGAKAVVFDLLFDRPSSDDKELIKAMQAARQAGVKVILGGEVHVSTTASGSTMTRLDGPIPEFANDTAWGLAEWQLGTAPLRRHFPGAEGVPSLALRTAELTMPQGLQSRPPERWINFYGPPGFISQCSYADALEPRLTGTNTFAGKVCFIGAWPSTPLAGGVRVDEWSTPYSRWGDGKSPGVEITATVYLNLAHHEWLTRAPALGEVLIVILAGIVFGFGLCLLRPIVATTAGVCSALMVAAAACWWMWHQQVWFSWLIIAGVQIPAAIGWSALAYTKRITREKALLEEKLVTVTHPPEAAVSATGLATIPEPDRGAKAVVAADAPTVRQGERLAVIPDHAMLRRIGKGAYGEVWLARNAIGTYHAVKIIRREDFDEAEPFEREFRGIQKFMPVSRSHPGLVAILHVGRHDRDGFIYYIMEAADDKITGPQINPDTYLPKNLAKEIHRRGHLPATECLQLGIDLTAALDFLHQQRLIHRDIKPANIIFVRGSPKFADIGLVTDIAVTGREVTYLGTKGYIAPEGPGTPAADVYSLGKVLYEATMGLGCKQFPELSSTLLQRPDYRESLQLNSIFLKACRQEASQRYRTAAEMREDLLKLQAGHLGRESG